ncbi:hypothetical protein B0H10DRAFT_2229558 [Mycena sp. CBHHK59/15]|nr:hypothetical protein B0H10DRAFT_2229558 [Mycena sp. CBHHK59/15]
MSQSTLGCAQKPNGTLLDASEIQWFNDVDDDHPISGSATASSSRPLAPIFTRAKPVGKIAGSRRPSPRRSSRSTRPSARITDPNNIEAPTVSVKRKSQAALSTPRKAARIAEESDAQLSDGDGDSDSDVASVAPSAGGDTEHEGEEPLVAMEVDSEEYESIKAMADADHAHATAKIAREDPTADIRTDGAICMVCTRKGCKASLCWLTGSVTTLRKHIARHRDHFDLYEARCQKLGIPLNERAIPQARHIQVLDIHSWVLQGCSRGEMATLVTPHISRGKPAIPLNGPRQRVAPKRLVDGSNSEAPSTAHQAIVGRTQARLNAAGAVSRLIKNIEHLDAVLPTTVAEGTDQDEIHRVLTPSTA